MKTRSKEFIYIIVYLFATLTFPMRSFIASLCGRLSKNKKFKLIFVFGMGRSGTTFLGTSLAIEKKLASYIHQPVLNLLNIKTRKKSIREQNQYTISEAKKPLRLHYFTSMMLFCMLAGFFKKRESVICAKEIHMNDSLPEISGIFNAKIVLISRHPCGMIESMRRMEGLPHTFDIRGLTEMGAFWGKTYGRLKEQFKIHPDWIWINFEELCASPVIEYKKVYELAGLNWSQVIESAVIKKTTTPNDEYYGPNRVAKDQIDKWRWNLKPAEIEAIRQGSLPYKTDLYEGF